MPYARQYSKQEVSDLVQQSEGRTAPGRSQPGHVIANHVAQRGLSVSDRLRGAPMTTTLDTPLPMPAKGQPMPTRDETIEIWQEIASTRGKPIPGKKKLRRVYTEQFEKDAVDASGSFLDLQDALILIRFALNGQHGQAELAKLETGASHAIITTAIHAISHRRGSWKMYAASLGNDLTHVADIVAVTLVLYPLGGDQIHLQTAYPREG